MFKLEVEKEGQPLGMGQHFKPMLDAVMCESQYEQKVR